MLFGFRLGRLKWSPHGSPLSRHRYRRGYRERTNKDKTKSDDNLPLLEEGRAESGFTWAYPVEAIDPCSPCESCKNENTSECEHHQTYESLQKKSESPYGEMKVNSSCRPMLCRVDGCS
jgi:hypothetical protein